MKIKWGVPTLQVNYLLIPTTRTDNLDEFNAELAKVRDLNYPRLLRTSSGGISMRRFRGRGFDLTTNRWGAEIIIIDDRGSCRIQFRNKILKDDKIDENCLKITGKQSLYKFAEELKKIGIDLKNYEIKNGLEIKKKIEPPKIGLSRMSLKDLTFEGVNHIDINSSYPAGVKEFIPEFGPVIDRWYNLKKSGHKEYKAYLNLMIGTMQSSYVGYKFAHISEYAIRRNNEKLAKMAKWLTENGRMVIMYNTDGIWFQGQPLPQSMTGEGLGEFKQDHINCKFRAKSNGAYEFIENGIYHPVIRGKTKYDEIKERKSWNWGDIYNTDCGYVKKYRVSLNKGIEVVYENSELG